MIRSIADAMAGAQGITYPWERSYPPGLDWRRPPPARPLPALLEEAAATHRDRSCMDFLGRRHSYGETLDLIERTAKGLQELGVGEGTRVMLLLPNCPYFVIAFYAILKAGGTVVNANPLNAELELERQIADSAAEILITLDLPRFQATLSAVQLAAYRAAESQVVVHTYIGLAIALAIVAAMVWMNRKKLVEHTSPAGSILNAFGLLQRPRFAFGTLCIFLYVGAEVAVGSLIVNYLMQFDVLGLGAEAAGKHVPLYWGGAMVGRFLGAYVLRICSPGKVLAVAGGLAAALLLVSANSTGAVSGWSLLAIGLVNSIMFPTIFTLASEGLGERTAEGSGLICMAIVGGAIVPLITGFTADMSSLRLSLAVPAICYLLILVFGWYARRPLENC